MRYWNLPSKHIHVSNQANIHLFKVNNRNIRKKKLRNMFKLTVKTPEWHH